MWSMDVKWQCLLLVMHLTMQAGWKKVRHIVLRNAWGFDLEVSLSVDKISQLAYN